jgi:transcriptional regulator with XRE-family HTH domain
MRGPTSSKPISPVSYTVRDLRIWLGETQKQFAKRMNVSAGTVARWETAAPPTRDTLVRIYEVAKKEQYPAASTFRMLIAADPGVFSRVLSQADNDALEQPAILAHAAIDATIRSQPVYQPGNWLEAHGFLKKAWLAALSLSDKEPQKQMLMENLLELADRVTIGGRQLYEEIREAVQLVAKGNKK